MMGAPERERAAVGVRRPRAWGVVAILLVAALLPAGRSAGRTLAGPSMPEASAGFIKALAAKPASASYSAFVSFNPGSVADPEAWAEEHGLDVVSSFDSVDAIFARGTIGAFKHLTTDPNVAYLEENRTLTYASDTSSWATRARIARLPMPGGPYRDPSNNGLDGSGVGVALIDSGINGTHNDLATQIASHRTVVCAIPDPQTRKCVGADATITQLPNDSNTDSSSGHGTHVAGIITGTGAQSRGAEAGMSIEPTATYRGVATGSRLHVYAMGEANTGIAAAEALEHLITNLDTMTPRVRVVANSYADLSGTAYDPLSVMSDLVKQLVERGVTFVFPAGNVASPGTGATDQTSSFCKDPTPGVICVANYNDQESGSIAGFINPTSARGQGVNPATHPDISAPGTRITSSCVQQAQPLCNSSEAEAGWVPWYSTLSGTSMAAGNVVGAVAMIYQARPSITPAEVESAVESGARTINANSFETGAGLLNVPGALDVLGVPRDDRQVPATQFIANDPLGDISNHPQAADLLGLTVTQDADGTLVRYQLEVRGLDVGTQNGSVTLRVIQNVNGRRFASSARVTSSGIFGNDYDSQNNNAPPTGFSVSGTTITMTVPVGALGDPPNKAPAHNVFATSNSTAGSPVDMLPGGTGTEMITRPRFGDPYSIRRGPVPEQSTTPPPETTTPPPSETTSTTFSPPPSNSASPTPSASASRTPSPTPSRSPTKTVTPVPSASASATPTSSSSASTPPPGTRGTTSITLATSTSKTTYDRNVTLSGTVTRSAPCQGNLDVIVSRRLHGSQQLTPLSGPIPVSATSGSWAFETRVSNNASYVAEVDESSTCASSASTSADVLVKVLVEAEGPRRCKRRPLVTGKVRPNHGRTRILLKQRTGGRSRTVDRSRLDNRSRFKLKPPRCKGTYKVKWPKQNERNEAGVARL